MKILAILGSPHGLRGATNDVLSEVLAGCTGEGVETETVILSKQKIRYCVGCGNCLTKGVCTQKDDVPELHEKMREADGIILASPVYLGTVTGQMKTFLDRCLPLGHRPSFQGKYGISVAVSAGFFDVQTADYMLGVLIAFGVAPVGKVCGIAAGPGLLEQKEVVVAYARRLGQQLVTAIREQHEYPETGEQRRAHAFFRDLIYKYRHFFKADYKYWKEQGWLTMPLAEEEEARPAASASPSTTDTQLLTKLRSLLEAMPLAFDPAASKGLDAIIQLSLHSGQETLHYHFTIRNQTCQGEEGAATEPTLLLEGPAETWLAISEGRLDGAQAFMKGDFKVDGDMQVLMQFRSLFRNPQDTSS